MTERRDEIAETLRRRVLRGLQAGTLVRGDRLPSARELVDEFDADMRLILAAYRELVAEGLVELRPRGGIYVSASPRPEGGLLVPVPSEEWIADLLAQGVSREVPVVELSDWIRHWVETLRLHAAAIQTTPDQIAGICRELRDDYGLDATGVTVGELLTEDDAELPTGVRRADLLVTTEAHASVVRRVAARLGTTCIVAGIRPDLIQGEWRLLLKRPVYVVVRDEQFVRTISRFFAGTPGAENLRPLIVGRDDLSTIPDGAPTYVTRSAREALGDTRIAGRILPALRLFSAETARELIGFIVRANLAAFTARGVKVR